MLIPMKSVWHSGWKGDVVADTLLDRLTVPFDRNRNAGQTREFREEAEKPAGILRNLELILSSRAARRQHPAELAELELSALTSGVVRPAPIHDVSPDRLAAYLADVIRRCEPRLTSIEVSVLPETVGFRQALHLTAKLAKTDEYLSTVLTIKDAGISAATE